MMWLPRRSAWGFPPRRVHTDVQQVLDHLSHPRFTFVESETDADILYHFSHFKDYRWAPRACRGAHARPSWASL